MTRSRLTEQKEKTGVTLVAGSTRIECRDHQHAMKEFERLSVGRAEVISADGNKYIITRESCSK
jgi:hypothetical protein